MQPRAPGAPPMLRMRQMPRSSSGRRVEAVSTSTFSVASSPTEALGDALGRASAGATRFEPPVRARVDAGATRASELGAELRRLGAAEVELRQAAEAAAETVTGIEVDLARLEGEAAEARRRLDEAVSPGPTPRPAPGEDEAEAVDRDELAARVTRLEARRESLGRVNPLAKEEYETEKVRLEELSTQRADLEASLHELEALRDELTETVNRRFDETFAAVAANFEEVATTLFPGGEGRLRLVEPEDGEEAEAGVEVELRPAGKRITRLTLLSGGEKALGAISFLFALFLAKPCPFYLLDEVEAALDDTNIARFVELLRRYSDRAQFVVITHQKRTMEAADVLYGVTMGGDGVSQIVSRRLPREERVAAARRPPGPLGGLAEPVHEAVGVVGEPDRGADGRSPWTSTRPCDGRRRDAPVGRDAPRGGHRREPGAVDVRRANRDPERTRRCDDVDAGAADVDRPCRCARFGIDLEARRPRPVTQRLPRRRTQRSAAAPPTRRGSSRPPLAFATDVADVGRAAGGRGRRRREGEERTGFLGRLRESLSKSRRALVAEIGASFDPGDEEAWERLEEALIRADVGVPATAELVRRLEARGSRSPPGRARRRGRDALRRAADPRRRPRRRPSSSSSASTARARRRRSGSSRRSSRSTGARVLVGAADTFRAAAEEQLEIWAERAGADFVGGSRGADPAAVAFDAVEAGRARGKDVVLVDTAGRLHTQGNLMDELAKVRRVIAGRIDGAPHETLLVVDATTGQNGLQQARLFAEAAGVTGVALTKLDGSAKGGVAIAIAHELAIPVKLVGVGEGVDDLRPFDASDYARALIGTDS